MQSMFAPTIFAEASDWKAHPLQIRYERRRVTMLLKAFGLAECAPDLRKDYKDMWGEARLTFESFDRLFPTFPWQLVAQSFFWTGAHNPWMTLKSWFARFEKTFVWKWYSKYLLDYHAIRTGRAVLVEPIPETQRGRPLGMVFPLDGIRGGLILHNGPGPVTRSPVFRFNGIQPGEDQAGNIIEVPACCWVERYIPWLIEIAKSGWTSDTPLPSLTPPAPLPEARPGFWVEPWMMKVCKGNGPAGMVLAWLCRILLADPPGRYERRFLWCDQGQRCVQASHSRIAEEVQPYSARQVQTALGRLRKLKLIETDGMRIRLNNKAIMKAGGNTVIA